MAVMEKEWHPSWQVILQELVLSNSCEGDNETPRCYLMHQPYDCGDHETATETQGLARQTASSRGVWRARQHNLRTSRP